MTPEDFKKIQEKLDLANKIEGSGSEVLDQAYRDINRTNVILEAIRTHILERFNLFQEVTKEMYDEAMQDLNEILEMVQR
jgi:hypothetical protein